MKRTIAIVFLALLCASPAAAGDDPMAEMAACHVCKNFMPHMAELSPAMKTEIINLDNGMATMTAITDPEKVPMYHKTCDAMHQAGEESAHFSKEEADSKLCSLCQDMWAILAAGGHMSYGKTRNGDIMVLSSEDEKVQAKIAALQKKYQAMMGG